MHVHLLRCRCIPPLLLTAASIITRMHGKGLICIERDKGRCR